MKTSVAGLLCALLVAKVDALQAISHAALKSACTDNSDKSSCAAAIAQMIVSNSKQCFDSSSGDQGSYEACTHDFCQRECSSSAKSCSDTCESHANPLYDKFSRSSSGTAAAADLQSLDRAGLQAQVKEAAGEQAEALNELQQAQERMRGLSHRLAADAKKKISEGKSVSGDAEMKKVQEMSQIEDQIQQHIAKVEQFRGLASNQAPPAASFLQRRSVENHVQRRAAAAPEEQLAKEMTHDLETNFNKIAPFGKEDTAKELQSHAAKTQDTLVDAVENAEVAEIKRAVFRALTRLRAATIKEFDTIARLETQAIDAYNDAHHYRAENPLAHLHEDEAPVETDKLKSFH
jgi:hypothetical protein